MLGKRHMAIMYKFLSGVICTAFTMLIVFHDNKVAADDQSIGISIDTSEAATYPLNASDDEEEISWTIGEMALEVTKEDSKPLQVRSAGKSSLHSYNFVGKVGGVNFEQIAIPDPSISGQLIYLNYIKNAPDGLRVTATIGTEEIRCSIADWLLIPIVNFAESDFTVVTSLFGEGSNMNKFYYMQYHPAFKDSLLGLRILQADIMFISPKDNMYLPEMNGRTVLGFGETYAKPKENSELLRELYTLLDKHEYAAWLLTDTDQPVSFGVTDGVLTINASPYYYFWKRNAQSAKAHSRKVDEYNNFVDEYNQVIDKLKRLNAGYSQLVNKYNANDSSVSEKTINMMEVRIQKEELKLLAMEQELERVENDLEEGIIVDGVPQITETIKKMELLLYKLNPSVYDSVKTTAEYVSFFRYVKINNNANWKTFVESVSKANIHPSVKTPTRMLRKSD